jgi:hypothetical protein
MLVNLILVLICASERGLLIAVIFWLTTVCPFTCLKVKSPIEPSIFFKSPLNVAIVFSI